MILGLVIAVMLLATAPSAYAPTAFTVEYNQAQFQWRCFSGPFGAWKYSYLNVLESSDFRLTGNVLHTAWSYSPLVTGLEGESTVYTYDKKADLWIEHEGKVSYYYVPGYGPYQIVNFFRGYVKFEGTPNAGNFVHGVAYQWVYLYAPYSETPPVTNAVWSEKVGAWLVGFSIYLWDATGTTQAYNIPFPSPFIEPVPASNYNPLGL